MIEKNKISIIVPVYNAGKYLNRLIESILIQSYAEFEAIFIDDGSTDNSLSLLKEYAAIDSRILVVHQMNQGVSDARNVGLEKAKGEYIVFVDSDDYLPIDSLKNRIHAIEEADLLIASYKKVNINDTEIDRMPFSFCKKWDVDTALDNLFTSNEIGYQGYLWNKLFLTKIIKSYNVRFTSGIAYNEDGLFVLQYLLHCSDIRISNDVVYNYFINEASAMESLSGITDKDIDKFMSEFVAYDKMKNLLKCNRKNAYYLCLITCLERTLRLKKILGKKTRRIRRAIKKEQIKTVAQIVVSPNKKIRILKKIKAIGHMVLGK